MNKVIVPQNKNSICRFCLKSSKDLIIVNNQANIKLSKAGNVSFKKVLKKLCIKIDNAEYLPNGICCQCKNKLEDFYIFLEKVESNEEILHKVYGDCTIINPKKNDDSSTQSFQDFSSHYDGEPDHTYVKPTNDQLGETIPSICDARSENPKSSSLGDRLEVYIIKTKTDINKGLNKNKFDEMQEEHSKPEQQKEFERKEPFCIKQCFFCPKKFSNNNLRILHFIEHVIQATEATVSPRLFCQYCGLLATARQELADHINSQHNDEQNSTCESCNIRFSNNQELEEHFRRQHIENFEEEIDIDIMCLICKKVFDDTNQMMEHALEHLIRRHTCLSCRNVYICDAALNEHHKTHPRYRFKCPICGKLTCTSRTALREHIRNHSESKSFQCDLCQRTYKSMGRLKMHKKSHFRMNNICPICPYSTMSKSDFNTHLRVHTNERPFKCSFEECGKAFKTNSALCIHIREHLKIKMLSCEFCDYKTNRYNSLTHHRRIHTLEKPYSCEFCGKTFSRPYTLTVHLKKIHKK
ncbi:zinc finger protein 184-like [Coccinella septempunctata]|uniref:zinc finger protein 184-like n=1 Tax=Coccinella septempunctata TaxID=41139 RepID=UPI001D076ED5|nr:zinc finger protein 184-like [Coccinella septempunctata]